MFRIPDSRLYPSLSVEWTYSPMSVDFTVKFISSQGILPMAQQLQFTCDGCGRELTSWSDGNPYYMDDSGQKQYAYHPDHEGLARCIGNDAEHLCLNCGLEFKVDSRFPAAACPDCQSTDQVDTYELDGRPCPFCKRGIFRLDPGAMAIS
ncbi:MAG: hypothetical protein NT069_13605 [Planctomycetota bacterium]|nr:hypothetical protein [Planctomycetota bacterium]